MTNTALNFKTAPGHEVLAAAGKTMLRPGGKLATEQLFEWADFQPGETGELNPLTMSWGC